jgi:LuxR family maltose regulon positive regulatory protein
MAVRAAKQAGARARQPAVPAGDPVLAAKITAPGVPGWAVPRSRITELIARGTRSCPLTVVTGPPGGGKTMALALWAAAEPGAVAWVRLDGYDNRPGVFWSYVVAALRRAGVAVPDARPAAARRRPADRTFLVRLASALAAQNSPVTLVLDDLHLLTDPQVLDGLDFVLRNSGPGLRLAVSSRMDPPLRLHRYRLAGQLTEIRGTDLAFSVAEAGLLMTRHGCTLPADSLECLTRRTEGWAAGLRLAAISMGTHPDPGQFVTELAAEDSAVTGYLVEEVLSTQPRQVRDVLLSTSILEQVSAESARELAGDEQAGAILPALAQANAFVQPIGRGWYRYHPLFAEMLRLKLTREHPDRIAPLHRRAARWYEANGQLTDAVRHAVQAGDWPLAASMVIDGLAISEIIEPRGSQSLADEFANMPHGQAWTEPEPYLVSAAAALAMGRPESGISALDAAEGILERLPAGQQAAGQLAAAMIRLTASLRTADPEAAAVAATRAEGLVTMIPGERSARQRQIRAQVLSGRGAVELWAGHLAEAALAFDSGAAAATASGTEDERANCLGHFALVEALRGRLSHAVELAQATAPPAAGEQRPGGRHPNPAALAALAWAHLEHNELRRARGRLKQLDAALGVSPDKLIGALACLAAAHGALAAGHPEAAAQFVATARTGWPVPAWLDHRLSLAESRACMAAGDIEAALAAAKRAGSDSSLEAAATLAHAWIAARDATNARRALKPALATHCAVPERVRLQALLADARLSYDTGDPARGHRSLASALRLAEREQLRLPFVMERAWIEPALQRDPELAHACQRLLAPALRCDHFPAPPKILDQATILVAEPLTEREREVLRHVSGMLRNPEVANEMHISLDTVKTHLKHIYRKLATTHRSEAVRRARQLGLI